MCLPRCLQFSIGQSLRYEEVTFSPFYVTSFGPSTLLHWLLQGADPAAWDVGLHPEE